MNHRADAGSGSCRSLARPARSPPPSSGRSTYKLDEYAITPGSPSPSGRSSRSRATLTPGAKDDLPDRRVPHPAHDLAVDRRRDPSRARPARPRRRRSPGATCRPRSSPPRATSRCTTRRTARRSSAMRALGLTVTGAPRAWSSPRSPRSPRQLSELGVADRIVGAHGHVVNDACGLAAALARRASPTPRCPWTSSARRSRRRARSRTPRRRS